MTDTAPTADSRPESPIPRGRHPDRGEQHRLGPDASPLPRARLAHAGGRCALAGPACAVVRRAPTPDGDPGRLGALGAGPDHRRRHQPVPLVYDFGGFPAEVLPDGLPVAGRAGAGPARCPAARAAHPGVPGSGPRPRSRRLRAADDHVPGCGHPGLADVDAERGPARPGGGRPAAGAAPRRGCPDHGQRLHDPQLRCDQAGPDGRVRCPEPARGVRRLGRPKPWLARIWTRCWTTRRRHPVSRTPTRPSIISCRCSSRSAPAWRVPMARPRPRSTATGWRTRSARSSSPDHLLPFGDAPDGDVCGQD